MASFHSNCQRRLEELAACLAVFGDERLTEVTPAYAAAARAILGGDGAAAAEAFAATLDAQHTSCAGLVHVSSGSSRSEQDSAPLTASLVFSLPPGYPEAAALQCHVQSSSARLSRDAVDALSAQLQAQALAAQGSECVFQLAEALTAQLEQLQEQQQQQQQQEAAQSQPQAAGDDGSSIRRVLLHLDHMRDRQGYSATIKQWAGELQLTGWLLFWQQLILICLEGSGASVATYLSRARTMCVDVDSAGRKCRERMMTVLEDTAHPGGSGSAGSTQLERHWAAFCEVAAGSLEEVVAQLRPTHPYLDGAALRQLLGLRGPARGRAGGS